MGPRTLARPVLAVFLSGMLLGVAPVTAAPAGTAARVAPAAPLTGSALAWGSNQYGQLGNGTINDAATPLPVGGLVGITMQVAAGRLHSMALKADGTVMAWGINDAGQLGDGTTVSQLSPTPVLALTSVTKIAAGDLHNLALKADGTVWAWGYNGSGQLGNGSPDLIGTTPGQVIGLTNVTDIAAGGNHSLALKADGTVWAWGENFYGQLGNGASGVLTEPRPVQVVGLTAPGISIAGGYYHSLAVLSGGSVLAWGHNNSGQLGNGTTVDSPTPVAVTGAGIGAKVAAGPTHSIALKADFSVVAWGENSQGELGANSNVTPMLSPVQVYGLTSGIADIAASGAINGGHNLALLNDGSVVAWGRNSNGQLGDGTTTNRYTPVSVSGLSRAVTAIAVGADHSLAVQGPAITPGTAANVAAAGRNASAAVSWTAPASNGGTPLTGYVITPYGGPGTPVDIPSGSATSIVVAGLTNGVAYGFTVTARNSVGPGPESPRSNPVTPSDIPGDSAASMGWGSNAFGQMGDGSTVDRHIPVQTTGLSSGTAALSAGGDHSLALKVDGSVQAWGSNSDGQLGDGTLTNRALPAPVIGLLGGVAAVAAGLSHSLALRIDGSALGWGSDTYGELGDGGPVGLVGVRQPVAVRNLKDAIALAAGHHHSLALRSDFTVVAWGDNSSGQLGDGTTDGRPSPKPVLGLTSVTKIAAGGTHSLALMADGSVWAWGSNQFGQLGIGSAALLSTAPLQVIGLVNVIDIAAGRDHSLAVKSDGTVWAWGKNFDGQLGDGSLVDRNTPVQMVRVTPAITAVAAGSMHSLAVDASFTVWATGDNFYGQLGDGSATGTSVRIPVSGLTGTVKAIAAGGSHSMAIQSSP